MGDRGGTLRTKLKVRKDDRTVLNRYTETALRTIGKKFSRANTKQAQVQSYTFKLTSEETKADIEVTLEHIKAKGQTYSYSQPADYSAKTTIAGKECQGKDRGFKFKLTHSNQGLTFERV